MLARAGIADGEMEWSVPCRAIKATSAPEGREEMAIGDDGNPQGYEVISIGKNEMNPRYSFGIDMLARLKFRQQWRLR
jgi:hypothetical protein